MARHKATLLSALIMIFLLFAGSTRVLATGETEEDARTAITDAQNEVLNSYAAAAEAEKSGANITHLLSILNEAGMHLSKARLAYNMSDFTSAVYFANESRTELDDFASRANTLKDTAVHQHIWDLIINIVAPIAGSIGVVCGGVMVWFFLKKKYEKLGSAVA